MVPTSIPPLVWCSIWALPAAVLAPISFPAATAIAAIGLLFALWSKARWRRAGLAALPACLAAMPGPIGLRPLTPPGPLVLHGVVVGIVRTPSTGAVMLLVGDERAPVRIALDGELEALPGDEVRLLVHAAPAAVPLLPCSLHGIATTAKITAGTWSLRRLAAASRRALEQQLLQHLPGETGGMMATLVLGRDTRPDSELQAAHRATGLSHLLAVSGAHAAMLAFLLGLGGWHGRRRIGIGRRRTCIVLGLLMAYAAITGNEPPVLRAVVAYTIAALAAHLGRPCGATPLLLAPAMLTALLQPEALLGPSFLLSYAAVAGLALARPPRGDSRVLRWVVGPLIASAWATLLTAPLTLHFFGQLAPWTVLLTPLLAPLVGLLLLGGLLVAIAGLIAPPLATFLAHPLGSFANLYVEVVQWADHLPLTPLPAPFVPLLWTMLLVGFAAVVMVAWRPDRCRCALAAVLLSAPHFLPLHAAAKDRLQLLAIGHGQACLVCTKTGQQYAIDCGSLQHPFLAAERLAAAMPRRSLDLLVITHADADHHNGVPALLTRVAIARAVLPAALAESALAALLRANAVDVQILAPGERFVVGPQLLVCAPTLPKGASDNDQSLWAQVRVGATSVLMTGDAEELGIAAAIADGIAVPHDVLVLPHHGRANANAPWLFRHVRPRACLASAASGDGDTVLGPLARRLGAELWVTGQHGSLTLLDAPARVLPELLGRPLASPP